MPPKADFIMANVARVSGVANGPLVIMLSLNPIACYHSVHIYKYKFSDFDVAGVTQLTTSELVSIAVGAAIILGQSTREDPPNQCALSGYPGYTYEASLSLCYRTVASPLSVTAAEAACAADGTNSQLLRVSSVEVFNFLVQQKRRCFTFTCITYTCIMQSYS